MPIPPVDPDAPTGRLKRMLLPFAMSKAGLWFGINVAAKADPKLLKATGGRVSLTGVLPTVLLTVRGRKSGVERTVPLVYFTQGDHVYLMASSFGRPKLPAWYLNIKANPEVTLTARGVSDRYRAVEVEGPERDALYEKAKQVYAGYGMYEQKTAGIRHVPVLRLTPAR